MPRRPWGVALLSNTATPSGGPSAVTEHPGASTPTCSNSSFLRAEPQVQRIGGLAVHGCRRAASQPLHHDMLAASIGQGNGVTTVAVVRASSLTSIVDLEVRGVPPCSSLRCEEALATKDLGGQIGSPARPSRFQIEYDLDRLLIGVALVVAIHVNLELATIPTIPCLLFWKESCMCGPRRRLDVVPNHFTLAVHRERCPDAEAELAAPFGSVLYSWQRMAAARIGTPAPDRGGRHFPTTTQNGPILRWLAAVGHGSPASRYS